MAAARWVLVGGALALAAALWLGPELLGRSGGARPEGRDGRAVASPAAPTRPPREPAREPRIQKAAPELSAPRAFVADAVYGRCTDEAGDPVRGAWVRLLELDAAAGRAGARLAEVTTDHAGRFEFRGHAPHGPLLVVAEAAGRVARRRAVLPGLDHTIVLRPSHPLEGLVVDGASAAPVAGVRVSAEALRWTGDEVAERVAAETGAGGRFRLEGLPTGDTVAVLVQPPEHAARLVRLQHVGGGAHRIPLAPGRPLEGVVVERDTKRPVAGARITVGSLVPPPPAGTDGLAGDPLERRAAADPAHATTDARGAFALVVSAERGRPVSLRFSAPGFCTSARSLRGESGSGDPLRAELVRGGEIAGRVVDREGRPVAGVRVVAEGRNRGAGLVPDGGGHLRSGSGTSAVSDAGGRFLLRGLVPGPEPVVVRVAEPAAGTPGAAPRAALPEPGARAEVEVVVETGGAIEGRVTAGGRGVAAVVLWSREDGQQGRGSANDDGGFRLTGVPPGPARVRAVRRDGVRGAEAPAARVLVARGETATCVLDLGLEQLFAGRVVEVDGRGAREAQVTATGVRGGERPWSGGARCEPDGTFELWVPEDAGRAWILVGWRDERRVVREGLYAPATGLELVLPEAASLGLRIVDARTDEVLEGALVHWRPAGTASWSHAALDALRSAPDPEGVFHLTLPRGVVDVRASLAEEGYLSAERTGLVVGDVATVALTRGASLDLRFVDAFGAARGPGPEVRVELAREGARGEGLGIDPAGRATRRGLPSGRYTLSADGLEFEPRTLWVEGDGWLEERVQWRRAE